MSNRFNRVCNAEVFYLLAREGYSQPEKNVVLKLIEEALPKRAKIKSGFAEINNYWFIGAVHYNVDQLPDANGYRIALWYDGSHIGCPLTVVLGIAAGGYLGKFNPFIGFITGGLVTYLVLKFLNLTDYGAKVCLDIDSALSSFARENSYIINTKPTTDY